ncbi:MAG: hypothetical protein Alis3KO_35750 [Aliiglaciecola sp.]
MKSVKALKDILFLTFIIGVASVKASPQSMAQHETLMVDEHPIHVATWGDTTDQERPWIVMISGPIDTWHSDSAWFAANAKVLAKDYRVMVIDRAGQILDTLDAPVGYDHFATDMHLVLTHYAINDATLVSFASGNISAQIYFSNYTQQRAIDNVLLIDPDVLTPFSIARYAADAKPFKDNLNQYLDYISQGKYTPRVEQKNTADMAVLQALGKSDAMDWDYVDSIFKTRLLLNNQLNLFREIARYEEDLHAASQLNWPKQIPTSIVDTQFESHYIQNTDETDAKEGLIAWQKDAKTYYQSLAKLSANNSYVETDTEAHLFQVEQPKAVANLIKALRSIPSEQ